MTREHKLALIIGFSLVLVVGVLISDHFSKARSAQVATEITPGNATSFGNGANGLRVVSAADPAAGHGPTIITPPGTLAGPLSAPESALPPTSAPQQASSVGVITMNEPLPTGANGSDSGSLVARTVHAIGNARELVKDVQVPDTNSVRAIDPANGTLAARPNTALPTSLPVVNGLPAGTQNPTPSSSMSIPPKEEQVNGVPRSMLKRYDVSEGESIYRIAQETYGDGTLWSKLLDYNKGKIAANGAMRKGVTILLPPKEALLGKPLPPAAIEASKPEVKPGSQPTAKPDPRTEPKPERAIAAAAKTYTVQKGDSLSDIAKKTLGSSRRWNEIVEMNKGLLDDENTLVVGAVLKLPNR